MNIISICKLSFFGYPLLSLVLFYVCWVVGRLELGYWPVSVLDDPKYIGGMMDYVYFPSALFIFYAFWPIVVSSIVFQVVVFYRNISDWRSHVVHVFIAQATLGVSILYSMYFDYGRVIEWFWD
jgi:hypothetical protein